MTIDAYERRVLLKMLSFDLGAADAPWTPFGPATFERFRDAYRFASTRRPVTCRCGYSCPGPFMEMHDCLDFSGEKG